MHVPRGRQAHTELSMAGHWQQHWRSTCCSSHLVLRQSSRQAFQQVASPAPLPQRHWHARQPLHRCRVGRGFEWRAAKTECVAEQPSLRRSALLLLRWPPMRWLLAFASPGAAPGLRQGLLAMRSPLLQRAGDEGPAALVRSQVPASAPGAARGRLPCAMDQDTESQCCCAESCWRCLEPCDPSPECTAGPMLHPRQRSWRLGLQRGPSERALRRSQ